MTHARQNPPPSWVVSNLYNCLHSFHQRFHLFAQREMDENRRVPSRFGSWKISREAAAKLPQAARYWREMKSRGIDWGESSQEEIARELAFGDGHYEERRDMLETALRRLGSQRRPVDFPAVSRALQDGRDWARIITSQLKELDAMRAAQAERDQLVKDGVRWLTRVDAFLRNNRRSHSYVHQPDRGAAFRERLEGLRGDLEALSSIEWGAVFGAAGKDDSEGPRSSKDRPGYLLVPGYPEFYGFKGKAPAIARLRRLRRGPPSRPWVTKARRELKKAGVPAEICEDLLIAVALLPYKPAA